MNEEIHIDKRICQLKKRMNKEIYTYYVKKKQIITIIKIKYILKLFGPLLCDFCFCWVGAHCIFCGFKHSGKLV